MKKLFVISSENGKIILTETAPICAGVFPTTAVKIYAVGSTNAASIEVDAERIADVENKSYKVLV